MKKIKELIMSLFVKKVKLKPVAKKDTSDLPIRYRKGLKKGKINEKKN